MTLAQRLLIAIGVVTLATSLALGLGVREAWREAEEARFQAQLQEAMLRLERELKTQLRDLSDLIAPLCRHDPVVDSALVDLRAGTLDSSRRLSLSVRVPQLMEAFRLDELLLFTSGGEILGAGHAEGLVGKVDPALSALVRDEAARPSVRTQPLAVQAHCAKREGRFGVGVYAARNVADLLNRIGSDHGVELRLDPVPADTERMVRRFVLSDFGGLPVFAVQSRVPLTKALQRLDAKILLIGSVTIALALGLALLLSRGLARPIVELSRQARAAPGGEPQPVKARGGRELSEFVAVFNRAISDLALLRKRLAATERIAARREIARQVAHEIKNPLAPIRAAIETLRRLRARSDPAFDDYFDEATRTVLEEVTRIAGIVQEFTRFARLPPPNPGPVDLVDVTRGIAALYSGGTVEIRLELADCPTVQADRDQVVQVLTNLIQNAVEALEGRPEPRIKIALNCVVDRAVLSVEDNGPGVAPEFRDRLFEPYATSKPQGTGLGLAIVERIVVEHGGEIRHEDVAGGGARFTVSLPVSGPSLLPEPPKSERLSRETTRGTHDRLE